MIFTLKNEVPTDISEHQEFLLNFKPFQSRTVATSAGGWSEGFSEPFLAMFDTGARHTCISSARMQQILAKVFDENGKPLVPFDKVKSRGVYGNEQWSPLYKLPHLYIGYLHLTDVVVCVPDSRNFDCLIGRSVLHQCVSTYDPETDEIILDFKESLKAKKQMLKGAYVFGTVEMYAEFQEAKTHTD